MLSQKFIGNFVSRFTRPARISSSVFFVFPTGLLFLSLFSFSIPPWTYFRSSPLLFAIPSAWRESIITDRQQSCRCAREYSFFLLLLNMTPITFTSRFSTNRLKFHSREIIVWKLFRLLFHYHVARTRRRDFCKWNNRCWFCINFCPIVYKFPLFLFLFFLFLLPLLFRVLVGRKKDYSECTFCFKNISIFRSVESQLIIRSVWSTYVCVHLGISMKYRHKRNENVGRWILHQKIVTEIRNNKQMKHRLISIV